MIVAQFSCPSIVRLDDTAKLPSFIRYKTAFVESSAPNVMKAMKHVVRWCKNNSKYYHCHSREQVQQREVYCFSIDDEGTAFEDGAEYYKDDSQWLKVQ